MTQAERDRHRRRPLADHDERARQRAVRRRLGARRPTRPRPGPTWSTATSRPRSTPALGIPLIYGVDSVHGHGNLLGATVFPHNIGLGATRDPALVEKIGHITAEETRASGPQWAFAPCLCVARDDRWGRTYESFGENPAPGEVDGDRDRRPPGPARPARRRRPGAGHAPSTSRATGSRPTTSRGRHRRLPDRPGHRPGHARRSSTSSRWRPTSRRSRSTTSAR